MPATEQISLIIPCFNPRAGWGERFVESIHEIQGNLKIPLNIILINDGSTLGINGLDLHFLEQQIKDLNYISYPFNKGKGHALRAGVKMSKNSICIYTDIDFPYTEESFMAVADALINGKADVAVGQRDEKYYGHVPFIRKIISRSLKGLVKYLLNSEITDTQCGLKGFNARGKEIFLKTNINRYLFDLEFIYCAIHRRLKIASVKVELRENVVFRKMNFKILITEGFNLIKLLIWKHC